LLLLLLHRQRSRLLQYLFCNAAATPPVLLLCNAIAASKCRCCPITQKDHFPPVGDIEVCGEVHLAREKGLGSTRGADLLLVERAAWHGVQL
jgi:hypothetical protein